MPDVLIVVDMQEAAVQSGRQYDLANTIARQNQLIAFVRALHGTIIFIQHDGEVGDPWEPGSAGWQISARLDRSPNDLLVRKRTNDPFYQTMLDDLLQGMSVDRLLVCGWATDFCVDSTVRSATARGYTVFVAADGHTCDDRLHLRASEVIAHHNTTWMGLIAPGGIHVRPVADICTHSAS